MTRRKLTFILRHPLIARRHHKRVTAPWPYVEVQGIEWCPIHHGVIDECGSDTDFCDMAFADDTDTNTCKPETIYYKETSS